MFKLGCLGHSRAGADQQSVKFSGNPPMSQVLLTALFALCISLLTFAASFADAPESIYVPAAVQSE